MSSKPESSERQYSPAAPEQLLARTKHRSYVIRRRRVLGAGGSVAVVLALVLGGILIPGSSRPGGTHGGHVYTADRIGSAYELTAAPQAVAAASPRVLGGVESAEVGFSLDLLDHLDSSGNSTNTLVSPSSLATALAMLELGAKGSTASGIAATLRTAGFSAGEQAAGWHSLAAVLAAETSTSGSDLAKVPELNVANALWVQDHFAVEPAFIHALSSDFGTGLWQANFESDLTGATDAINQWTSENTKGLIKQLFSPGALDVLTRLVIADAVYFDAHWATAFKTATKDRTFYLPSGATVSVPFMTSQSPSAPATTGSPKPLKVPVAETNSYDAVELPYGGKKLSALIVMPTTGSLASFVSALTPSSLARIVKGLSSPAEVELSMPTFTIRSDDQLNASLSSMGMAQAFGPDADFGGINPKVALQVQAVEQHAYLQVSPKGTVAAAATGIAIGVSAVEAVHPIVINHPFLFLVRDNATGTILFESMVENPTG
jgi:serpin B